LRRGGGERRLDEWEEAWRAIDFERRGKRALRKKKAQGGLGGKKKFITQSMEGRSIKAPFCEGRSESAGNYHVKERGAVMMRGKEALPRREKERGRKRPQALETPMAAVRATKGKKPGREWAAHAKKRKSRVQSRFRGGGGRIEYFQKGTHRH